MDREIAKEILNRAIDDGLLTDQEISAGNFLFEEIYRTEEKIPKGRSCINCDNIVKTFDQGLKETFYFCIIENRYINEAERDQICRSCNKFCFSEDQKPVTICCKNCANLITETKVALGITTYTCRLGGNKGLISKSTVSYINCGRFIPSIFCYGRDDS